MRIYDYSLGQIQCILLSEHADSTTILCCEMIVQYMTNRENDMKNYQVKTDVEKVRDRKIEVSKRVIRSMEKDLQDTCVFVDE